MLWAGCEGSPDLSMYQSRRIEGTHPDEVLLVASKVLRREFGRIQLDSERQMIETDPVEFRTERESGTVRDLYGGGSTMRRVARFRVGKRGGGSVARLRIEVERQDTERAVAMQPPTGQLNESPAYDTPIQRDAATTMQQNTVWTFVRRDRRLERALLVEMGELLAGPEARSVDEDTTQEPASEE
jgi:hypothetical protein